MFFFAFSLHTDEKLCRCCLERGRREKIQEHGGIGNMEAGTSSLQGFLPALVWLITCSCENPARPPASVGCLPASCGQILLEAFALLSFLWFMEAAVPALCLRSVVGPRSVKRPSGMALCGPFCALILCPVPPRSSSQLWSFGGMLRLRVLSLGTSDN